MIFGNISNEYDFGLKNKPEENYTENKAKNLKLISNKCIYDLS